MLDGVDVSYDGRDIDQTVSHGTHVAGIIAARGANEVGLTGLAPRSVQVMPINVFFENPNNSAEVVTNSATVIKGISFAVANGADVINMSLGGSGNDPAMLAAIQAAVGSGVFVAVAASNEGQELGPEVQTYPALYASQIQGMVAVGSINSADKTKSSFSNYSTTLIEIAAPGSQSQDGNQNCRHCFHISS